MDLIPITFRADTPWLARALGVAVRSTLGFRAESHAWEVRVGLPPHTWTIEQMTRWLRKAHCRIKRDGTASQIIYDAIPNPFNRGTAIHDHYQRAINMWRRGDINRLDHLHQVAFRAGQHGSTESFDHIAAAYKAAGAAVLGMPQDLKQEEKA